jgi:hypothetical protein
MPTKNLERAGWAEKGLEAFGHTNGVSFEHEPDSAVGDFLADLMHLCDRAGLNFDDLLDKGRRHYDSETVCCKCGQRLKAGDDADGTDCVCKKCEEGINDEAAKTSKAN